MALRSTRTSVALGAREAVANPTGTSHVLIKNVSTLANDAYVGGANVDDTNGYRIQQTEEVEILATGPVFVYGAAAVDIVALWND